MPGGEARAMTDGATHRRPLPIGHYVLAGLVALLALFPIAYLTAGVAMVTGRVSGPPAPVDLTIFGWMFILIASTIITTGLLLAGCLAAAGRCLARRAHRTFCLATAALACLLMPFGTALGVLTIVVLRRHSVKRMFGLVEAAAPSD